VETTSYVTALMLFCYERNSSEGAQPESPDTAAPLLRQARVGLEWLLKMHPYPDEFYYQVGDESDHDRWRLPEDDSLEHDRAWKPRRVLFGVGANLAGRCAAAFAMAARQFRALDLAFASACGRA